MHHPARSRPARLSFRRRCIDRLARWTVSLGGLAVIVAIGLIFVYLVYAVYPLVMPAGIRPVDTRDQALPQLQGQLISSGRYAAWLQPEGRVRFYRLSDGALVATEALSEGVATAVSAAGGPDRYYAVATARGVVVMAVATTTRDSPEQAQPSAGPRLVYPYGRAPLIAADGPAIRALAYRDDAQGMAIASLDQEGQLKLYRWTKSVDFPSGEIWLQAQAAPLQMAAGDTEFVALSGDRRWLYLASRDGELAVYSLQAEAGIVQVERLQGEGGISQVNMLLGGVSLLVGRLDGRLDQYFPLRGENNRHRLTLVRSFSSLDNAVVSILPLARSKGFVAVDASGKLTLNHATSGHTSATAELGFAPLAAVLNADGTGLSVWAADGRMSRWAINNPHPEASLRALWTPLWYEHYPAPELVWQSSSASHDFEPKFSLVPLAVGTLKAAFYALLLAVPLALAAAIYTAYFMAPGLRQMIKPTIEVMEALPTVVLGFLAALWLAPLLDRALMPFLTLLVLIPVGVLGLSFLWQRLSPAPLAAGWLPLLLLPAVLGLAWLAVPVGHILELSLFDGDIQRWLSDHAGLDYHQRNALVVGLAMGFAVIPIIFSIAEDALFGVPRSLSQASFALGASRWQTLRRVVLPMAGPGIFSALLIGLGRAVGETMIVLMATGNTPLMGFNLFEGMRTLAANIAIELPESEVASTHYRVLFATALVLFIVTFLFNTIAEWVRQRLRRQYRAL